MADPTSPRRRYWRRSTHLPTIDKRESRAGRVPTERTPGQQIAEAADRLLPPRFGPQPDGRVGGQPPCGPFHRRRLERSRGVIPRRVRGLSRNRRRHAGRSRLLRSALGAAPPCALGSSQNRQPREVGSRASSAACLQLATTIAKCAAERCAQARTQVAANCRHLRRGAGFALVFHNFRLRCWAAIYCG